MAQLLYEITIPDCCTKELADQRAEGIVPEGRGSKYRQRSELMDGKRIDGEEN